jgi:HK97 family phage major capsid protein
MATSRELRQKLGEMVTQSRAIVDRADTEKRKRTAEEEAELRKYDTEMDQIEKDITSVEKVEKREAFLAQPVNEPAARVETRMAPADGEARQIEIEKEFRDRFGSMGEHIAKRIPTNPLATRTYRNAFSRWLTAAKGTGVSTLSPEEQRALSQGTNSEGGYTVPQEQFVAELIKQMDNESVIRGLARTFQIPQAQSLGAPTLSADPADQDWTSELLVGSEDSTMAFGKREMRPWPLAKYIKVSDKLLRASPLGMESIVRGRLAYKQAVAHSTAFNSGSGANQPLGLYTASTSGISTGRDIDVSASNAYSADGFIAARYTLRSGYWPNARWHMHRNMLAQIRKLKSALDQGGNYLWQPGLTVGAPNTFLDFPYVVDEYAPSAVTTITGGYVAILGDFNSYWIVDALDIRLQRLDELFALTNQVGFVIRSETDGQPVLEDAFVRCKATIT